MINTERHLNALHFMCVGSFARKWNILFCRKSSEQYIFALCLRLTAFRESEREAWLGRLKGIIERPYSLVKCERYAESWLGSFRSKTLFYLNKYFVLRYYHVCILNSMSLVLILCLCCFQYIVLWSRCGAHWSLASSQQKLEKIKFHRIFL